jgi:hypothetical protein
MQRRGWAGYGFSRYVRVYLDILATCCLDTWTRCLPRFGVCVCVCVFVCVMMDAEKFFAYVALCRVVFSYCLRRKHKKWGQLEPIWYRALGIPWCLTVLSTWRVLCAALLGTSRDGNGMGARSG